MRDREAAMAAAHEDLMARLERMATDPRDWEEFLVTVAEWGARYSLGNQLLLLAQCEERGVSPQMFLPYGKPDGSSGWRRQHRTVVKGAKGFKVWAPVKRRLRETEVDDYERRHRCTVTRDHADRLPKVLVGWKFESTFELSQTAPIPPWADNYVVPTVEVRRRRKLAGGSRPVLLDGHDPTGIYDDVVALIEQAGYDFALAPRGSEELGQANGRTRGAGHHTVRVRDDLSRAHTIKTTVHELAHIRCGHLDPESLADIDLHRGRRETEAESVAHIVCKSFGLDSESYTDAYVMTWAGGDMEVVRAAASTVLRVARGIVEDLAPLAPFTDRPAVAEGPANGNTADR